MFFLADNLNDMTQGKWSKSFLIKNQYFLYTIFIPWNVLVFLSRVMNWDSSIYSQYLWYIWSDNYFIFRFGFWMELVPLLVKGWLQLEKLCIPCSMKCFSFICLLRFPVSELALNLNYNFMIMLLENMPLNLINFCIVDIFWLIPCSR